MSLTPPHTPITARMKGWRGGIGTYIHTWSCRGGGRVGGNGARKWVFKGIIEVMLGKAGFEKVEFCFLKSNYLGNKYRYLPLIHHHGLAPKIGRKKI